MRIVPLEEVEKHDFFWDLAELAVIFNHEIVEHVEDGHKRWRWKENGLMRQLADDFPSQTGGRHRLCFNTLVQDVLDGKHSVEERMKFYMQIGYSLSGFCEIFGQHEAVEFKLPGAKRPPAGERENYTETIIDYMRRIHKGKILKM